MTLIDGKQRAQATDTTQSYIVQAPAGSGKTEILTQRFLRLLGTVNAPEQIVALTFTRKAANEMRERILLTLQRVARGVTASSEHQQKTHEYARIALDRDQALAWNLLKQPTRLRVITIDSLCQIITRAIPLQDNHIHYAQITDTPKTLYLTAAQACLRFASEETAYHAALKTLLHHMDNRQDIVLALLSDLLAKRDQWIHPLYQARLQDKAIFEQAIAWIEHHELSRFRQGLPLELAHRLMASIRMLMSVRTDATKTTTQLHDWTTLEQLDSKLAAELASILLTSQNTLRKAFDHHIGLKRGVCSDDVYNALKQDSKLLLAQLENVPDFLESLIRIRHLPNPQYDPMQWEVLQALFSLLPLLVAHLNLLFAEHNAVDFTAISQQALLALGDEQTPTDLALYLDNQIQHLLVDEFQDTSIQQFQLLTQLVQGWESNDGRTLFIVGDPMQSIYRFRAAEVGLFLRTQMQGIGPVTLHPLELTCNFRSTSTIVDWVNQQFRAIFPKTNDIESGAVSFHPSAHVRPADETSFIQALQFEHKNDEARAVVDVVVHELQTYPNDNIAILVRSRSQLTRIMHTLRECHIPFQGVDIDLLANLPHLRDVWSLTQALLMPSNRLAWLSFLRSPWCGLSLADLHSIANVSKSQSIYFALSQLDHIANISEEGRTRSSFIYSVLDDALTKRHQQPLVDWITDTLQQLHRDHVLTASQQDDLEQYWLLLEKFEEDGQIPDLSLFKNELNALYSKKVTPARLQIMTIHKSKGLEFDCVILPGLGSKPANRDAPLLRWLTLPTKQADDILLVSPVKAAHDDTCLLYDYLGKLDAEKSSYESQRLLYVAATRAKKRLYLFDNHLTPRQGTFRHLLQQHEFEESEQASPDLTTSSETDLPKLYQLPLSFYSKPLPIDKHARTNPIGMASSTPRLIGIVAHELLQWICNHHPQIIEDIPWDLAKQQLTTMGFTGDDLYQATTQLSEQITQLFANPIGQWLIQPHTQERNEYELLTEGHEAVATRIIDRTFYDKGIRWIIDFKTGHDDQITEKNHRKQVNEYASLFAKNTSNPICCGLYYLATSHWIEWEYSVAVL
ncbi:MAG: UvrD-helicase domain-containing protein [Legionellaceae bacterium]|nr:UvrD-helicase domain-containing protein [Legionellaceae bacterium]